MKCMPCRLETVCKAPLYACTPIILCIIHVFVVRCIVYNSRFIPLTRLYFWTYIPSRSPSWSIIYACKACVILISSIDITGGCIMPILDIHTSAFICAADGSIYISGYHFKRLVHLPVVDLNQKRSQLCILMKGIVGRWSP